MMFPLFNHYKLLAPLAVESTLCNVVETSTQNPAIKTTFKVAQIAPSCVLLMAAIAGNLYQNLMDGFHPTRPPDYVYFDQRDAYARFASRAISLRIGVIFLSIPIVLKVLQIAVKKFQWNTIEKIITISDKCATAAIKITHIALTALFFLSTCAEGAPIWIGLYGGLLALNVWAAVRHVFQPKVEPISES